jgi:hypothetical protein
MVKVAASAMARDSLAIPVCKDESLVRESPKGTTQKISNRPRGEK